MLDEAAPGPRADKPTLREIAHDFLALQLALLLGRLKHPWWRRALPYAVSDVAVLWLVLVGGGAFFYPEWAYHRAKSALVSAGYYVYGNRAEGHAIGTISDRWVENARDSQTLIASLGHLRPVVSLNISDHSELASLEGLPDLP